MHFDAATFWDLLLSRAFVLPALTTCWVTIAAMAIGIVLGLFGALGAMSRCIVLQASVAGYLWLFRGTPLLVQIVFWYDAVAELTGNRINLPALLAGIIALGIHEGAYMTEIVRSGLLSVDVGQIEAARSLGMTYPLMMRRIIMPQALRIIIPPTGNQIISMLKTTSLLFTIAVPELFGTATNIYSANFRYFEVLAVVSIWYLALTSGLTLIERWLERHFGLRSARKAGRERNIVSRIIEAGFGKETA